MLTFNIEEWISYLLTLGPSVILDLATPSDQPGPSGFRLAAENGWTKWENPEDGSSRSTFLHDAVGRVYDEKMAAVRIPQRSHSRNVSSTSARRLAPPVHEKPASRSPDRQRHVAYGQDAGNRGHSPEIREQIITDDRQGREWAGPPHSGRRLESSPGPRSNSITPSPASNARSPVGVKQVDDPVDKAVWRLAGMGFPADMAKRALAETDTGENLNVKAAIDLCMMWTGRQHSHMGKPAGQGLGLQMAY